MNHPFTDGNKRVAVTALLTTLRLGNVRIDYAQQELVALGLGISDASLDCESVADWIHAHLSE
ncbi:MAG: type II toxin-antitoxin system death-on-curing family toxin [Clostridiales bacterium]|jgi:death-on-curing family protein|nr:type II toxin-antitoxin system death-on-curing family toxin [Clostridiales bacterium]